MTAYILTLLIGVVLGIWIALAWLWRGLDDDEGTTR